MVVGNEMVIFITLTNTILASGMKNVATASGDYLVYFHTLTIVSNIFMRNGTYPLMFIGRVYNRMGLRSQQTLLRNQEMRLFYGSLLE